MRYLVGITLALMVLASLPIASAAAAVVPARHSDFNGDGYADLAIGVPAEDVNGLSNAGAVNVLYGSPTGITSAENQSWTKDTDGIPGTAQAFDRFGSSIASADFDLDGFADLVIEALGTTDRGSLTIIYGAANGLAADNSQTWTGDDFMNPPGGGERDGFAGSLAAGDYDGDGYEDLASGGLFRNVDLDYAFGVVDVMFGGPGGLTAVGAMQFSQTPPHMPGDPGQIVGFGSALDAGDFDGDGIDDLAVGVPGDWVYGASKHAGSVTILYGTVDGPSGVGAQIWTQYTPGIGGSSLYDDRFGRALATGDFDRDGYDDLAIGVPNDKIAGIRTGSVNVIYGSAAGLTASGSKWWHQGSTGVPGANEKGDSFGESLAAGDFDSDGADDLAIGNSSENVGRIVNAGTVTVLYGSSIGLRSTRAVTLSQNSSGVPGRSEQGDRFGAALAAGNFGRFNRDDLAVGVYHEQVGTARRGGVVDVLYGRRSGLSGIGAQGWSQDSPGILGVVGAGDDFGWALTP